MAGYIRLIDKNPDLHDGNRRKKAKIVAAKLAELVGGRPDFVQTVLIRGLATMYLRSEDLRLAYEAGGELDPDYAKIQGLIRQGLSQLESTTPAGRKRGRPSKDESVGSMKKPPIGSFLEDQTSTTFR